MIPVPRVPSQPLKVQPCHFLMGKGEGLCVSHILFTWSSWDKKDKLRVVAGAPAMVSL